MLHRSYAVRITASSMTPAALADLVAARLNQVSPEMAVFRKTRAGDRLAALLYNRLRLAKEIQLNMWSTRNEGSRSAYAYLQCP